MDMTSEHLRVLCEMKRTLFLNLVPASPAQLERFVYFLFSHDTGEIFWPRPIRSLTLGHVTGQASMSPTSVGWVSDPGKNSFHKKCKHLDNIAVYLTTSLKSKWKINNKKYDELAMIIFIDVLEGNLQWNSWIFKMTDYLKVSIIKFQLNFEKALENKRESIWRWQI